MSLSDALGISIAFITLILLMSVFVTALVQTAQGILRLRARNLLKGVSSVLLNLRFPDPTRPVGRGDIRAAKRDAMKLLNTPVLAGSTRILPSNVRKAFNWGPESDLRYFVAGPRISQIDSKDLKDALAQASVDLKEDAKEQLPEAFERISLQLDKRMQMMARGWSFAMAIVVALVLQVSTPALLSRLARDSEYRERILAKVDTESKFAEDAIPRVDYERAAVSALEQIEQEYPDAKGRILQASGIGANKALIVDELRVALDGVANADAIVARYQNLLDAAASQSATDAKTTLEHLNSYDIGFWPDNEFYYGAEAVPQTSASDLDPETTTRPTTTGAKIKWRNLLGVLMTAILLSLGAPFWYKLLKDVIGLRDKLTGKKSDSDGGTGETSAGNASGGRAAPNPPPAPQPSNKTGED